MVVITAKPHSGKPGFRFCVGSNPACGVLKIDNGEDFRQWSWLGYLLGWTSGNMVSKGFLTYPKSCSARILIEQRRYKKVSRIDRTDQNS